MAQILFLAILVGGGWYLYRKFVGDAQKLAQRRRAEARERETGAVGTLIKDEKTGEYRVRRNEE